VHICKSYCEKNQWHFFYADTVYVPQNGFSGGFRVKLWKCCVLTPKRHYPARLTRFFLGSQVSKWLFHICWQNPQYKRSWLQTPPYSLPSRCAQMFLCWKSTKPWNSSPAELHHFSTVSVFKRFIWFVWVCYMLVFSLYFICMAC